MGLYPVIRTVIWLSKKLEWFWVSGGLYYCAQQLHLENGDTLIVDLEDVLEFLAGDSVSVKYREIGRNKNCSPGIDGEIIEIIKLE